MADQGRWFKLWVSALDDPDLDNLPIADFGRWAKFGTYMKAHGTNGTVSLCPPCRSLVAHLQLPDFDALKMWLEGMRNFTVSGETSITVTSRNWMKYQGDFSTPRVQKMREMKRSKRRREEKRGEEKKPTSPISPPAWAQDLVSRWNRAAVLSRQAHPPGLHLVDVEITQKRLRLLRARWKDTSEDPAWWEDVFQRLATSAFACGCVPGKNGQPGWRASLDWVMRDDTNAVKVKEGRYDG